MTKAKKKSQPLQVTTIRLPGAVIKKLNTAAKRLKKPRGEIVREILEDHT